MDVFVTDVDHIFCFLKMDLFPSGRFFPWTLFPTFLSIITVSGLCARYDIRTYVQLVAVNER